MTNLRAGLLLASASLAAVPSKADITVLPDGSVGPVVGLEQALALAQPGETLYLMPGDYAGVSIQAQAVRIVSAGGGPVTIGRRSGFEGDQNLDISDLAEGQQVFLSGVILDQQGSQQESPTLAVSNCAGSVVLHDVVARSSQPGIHAAIDVVAVDTLVMDGCDVQGAVANPFLSAIGGIGLESQDSRLFLNHCTVIGGNDSINLFGASGKFAIRSTGDELFIHGGELRGGDGFFDPKSGGGAPAAALLIQGPTELSGASDARIAGGDGYLSPVGQVPGAPAVILGLQATLQVYGGLAVEGGVDGGGVAAEPYFFFSPAATLSETPDQHRPGLHTEPASASPGDSFDLVTEGTPGAAQVVLFNLGLTQAYAVPAFDGLALLLPSGAAIFLTVPGLPASGSTASAITVPPAPSLVGVTGWFQSYELQQASGAPLIGLPAGIQVR